MTDLTVSTTENSVISETTENDVTVASTPHTVEVIDASNDLVVSESSNDLTVSQSINTLSAAQSINSVTISSLGLQGAQGEAGAAATMTTDILGVTSVGQRTNQVELSFHTSFDSDVITNSATGGANASISNGHALYSSGNNTTSQVTGTSVQSVVYRPGHEQYIYFTAAFTTPSSSNSVQRIGLFDASNGFFIGYEGLTFGATKRTGGVDTQVALASFNGDLLDGGASSNFKRDSVPEAIDLAKSNLYRIRWAWLGSAPVQFEVFSPDGEWITFHTLRFPNLQLNPSIETPNLPVKIQVQKTGADATNLILYTACIAGGTTTNLEKVTTALTDDTLAALNRSVIAGRSSSGGGTYYNVKVTPSGSILTAIGDIGDVAGQQTMADSLPVVLASDQSSIPVTQSGTWNINDITGTVSLPSGAATSANQTAVISKLTDINNAQLPDGHNVTVDNAGGASAVNIQDGGNSITVDGSVSATQSGTWNINDISGTVSLPTGAATSANQSSILSKLTDINTAQLADGHNVTIDNGAGVAAVNIQDGGNSITVDGTISANQSGTWNINDVSGTVSLPTGAATSANQSSVISKLTDINNAQLADGHNVTIDNGAGAAAVNIQDGGNSITVDGAVAATQSGTWNINNISGTVSLPTGAATAANQTTIISELQATGASAQEVQGNTAVNAALAGKVMPISSKELITGLQKQPTLYEVGGVVYSLALSPDASLNFVSYTASGEQYVFPASTNNTKANARYLTVDSSGHLFTKTQSLNTALTAINATYNNVTTTNTSANISCSGYREAAVSFTITKANTPTDITFEVECSLDGTNYAKHTNGPLSSWVYDDTAVGASGISRCLVFPICYSHIRVFVRATGTTASNTFTIANANLYLRN